MFIANIFLFISEKPVVEEVAERVIGKLKMISLILKSLILKNAYLFVYYSVCLSIYVPVMTF